MREGVWGLGSCGFVFGLLGIEAFWLGILALHWDWVRHWAFISASASASA